MSGELSENCGGAGSVKDEAAKPAVGNEVGMTRSELLEYIRLKLWDELSKKLRWWAGAILAGYAILGTLGIKFYLNSQIDARTREAATRYSERSQALLRYAGLQTLLVQAYSVKRLELTQQVVLSVDSIDRVLSTTKVQELRNQLDGARHYLIEDIWWDEYASEEVSPRNLRGISLPRVDLYPALAILPHRSITVEESIGGKGMMASSMPHAVQDGTLRGVMLDVKFRIVELRAFRRAMQEMNRRIVTGIVATNLERPPTSQDLKIIVNEEFLPVYAQSVEETADQFLLGAEKDIFGKYESLYRIQNILPPERDTGTP